MCTIQFKQSLTWIRVVIYTSRDTNLCYKARLSCEKQNIYLAILMRKLDIKLLTNRLLARGNSQLPFFFPLFGNMSWFLPSEAITSYQGKLHHHFQIHTLDKYWGV